MSNLLNLFGSFESERPIETFGSVSFADAHEELVPTNQEEISVETFNAYDQKERAEMGVTALNHQFMNCNDMACGGPRKKPLFFTKNICKETNTCCWEFFLTDVMFTVMNDFVSKLEQVKDTDCILVHGPATCYGDDAEVVCSAIERCKAKEKIISSPYILDIGAASILLTATKILNSVCGLIRLSPPRISGGGVVQDARMAFENDIYRKTLVLKNLMAAGFITQEEFNHLVEEQGGVCLHGKKLAQIIDVYNQKHA